jgi:hypothetical protein
VARPADGPEPSPVARQVADATAEPVSGYSGYSRGRAAEGEDLIRNGPIFVQFLRVPTSWNAPEKAEIHWRLPEALNKLELTGYLHGF